MVWKECDRLITVLHYAPGFLSGGIESRLLDWYRNIDRKLIRFIIIKLNDIDDTKNIEEFIQLGGTVYNLPSLKKINVFLLTRRIKKIIMKEKVDIVHVHDINSGFFALKAAKKSKVKCRIYHSRTNNFSSNEKKLFIKKFFMNKAPKYATNYWACSEAAGLFAFGERFIAEGFVLKNGIQLDYYKFDEKKRNMIRKKHGIIETDIIIGCVCRIIESKNISFLLKIIDSLNKIEKKYKLLLVGSGDMNIIYNYYDGKVPDYIFMAGEIKNVWDYYFAFDIFCSPSKYEGFGTTAVEAQAAGLPTFVSNGFPERVELTKNIKRLDIFDEKIWVNNILKADIRRDLQSYDIIKENGYDAKDVAKYLQSFYLKQYEN